jgi:hypothetical protein
MDTIMTTSCILPDTQLEIDMRKADQTAIACRGSRASAPARMMESPPQRGN